MYIFRRIFKDHRETQKTWVLVSLCRLAAVWSWAKYVTRWASGSLASNEHNALPSSESGRENVIGSVLQTTKHFVNTYSVNKYLLRVYQGPGIVPLRLLPSLPTQHLFGSITGCRFQMQPARWSQSTHLFTQFFSLLNHHSLASIGRYLMTSQPWEALGRVSTKDDGNKGLLPPLLPQRA